MGWLFQTDRITCAQALKQKRFGHQEAENWVWLKNREHGENDRSTRGETPWARLPNRDFLLRTTGGFSAGMAWLNPHFTMTPVASGWKKTWTVEPVIIIYVRDDNSLAPNVAATLLRGRQIQAYFRSRTNKSHCWIVYVGDIKERIRDDSHRVAYLYVAYFQ